MCLQFELVMVPMVSEERNGSQVFSLHACPAEPLLELPGIEIFSGKLANYSETNALPKVPTAG